MQLADNCVIEQPVSHKCVGKSLEEIDAEVLKYVPSEGKIID
jgi:DNA-directed RNA polymerase subunit omega